MPRAADPIIPHPTNRHRRVSIPSELSPLGLSPNLLQSLSWYTVSLVANGALWQRYLTGTFLRGASLGGGRWMRHAVIPLFVAVVAFCLVASVASAGRPAGLSSGTLGFTTSVLLESNGSSEPAVAIGADGRVVYTALSWILFRTNVWTGPFGSTPTFQGAPDAHIDGAI